VGKKKRKRSSRPKFTPEMISEWIANNPDAHRGFPGNNFAGVRFYDLHGKFEVRDSFTGDHSEALVIEDTQSCYFIASYTEKLPDLKLLSQHSNPSVRAIAERRLSSKS
jgi:hypothetical protein